MASPSKSKGTRLEVLVVKEAQARGLPAQRAWGSNGRALGWTEDVDIVLGGLKVQCKARKAIAEYMLPPPGADITVLQLIRRGRTEAPLAVVPLDMLLDLLAATQAQG